MSAEPQEPEKLHGGRLVARRLKAHGVRRVFTLSGGHLFSIYDGCRAEGIELVDVRHESAAAFAAEGWAKVTREPGVCALTAGPGVTNGMSALASAQQNHSPMLMLGGRAPALRWGRGSLQEVDHVPFVRPLVKLATTASSTAEIPGLIDDAWAEALRPHSGPTFVDFPLDHVFMEAEEAEPAEVPARAPALPDPRMLDRAVALLRDAERPVVMAGTNLYWGHGEHALASWPRPWACPSSSTASRAAASRPIIRTSSRARDGRACREPTSRSSSACRWTSGSASARRSGRTAS